MKKILLGTTALIGAAGLFAGAAVAGELTVKLGGTAEWQAGIMNDDLDAGQRAQGFRNDTEININVTGVADNGLTYGAEVDLEADVTPDARGQGTNASRTYLFLQGAWGRVEMGSTEGVEDKLKVDASNIASATGGIDGDWLYYANFGNANFIVTPDLPLAYGLAVDLNNLGSERSNNVNKISYFTPRFSGFQGGISYAPDSFDRGQTVTRGDNNPGGSGNNVTAALNYEGNFSGVGVKAAATGEWGQAEVAGEQDLAAWNAGAVLSYMGFSVAGSYGDWNDSRQASNNEQHYWTAGGAYATGPWSVSVTYLKSEAGVSGDDDFHNVVVGTDYALAPGLTTYAEVSFYDFDAPGTASDNTGTVGIIGARLGF